MNMKTWKFTNLTSLDLAVDESDGDVLTIQIGTPSGEVKMMAEIAFDERTLVVRGLHIHSSGGPLTVGIANLRVLVQFVLERIDCDEARIEGAIRTTGANPGRRPRGLRFTRKSDPPLAD